MRLFLFLTILPLAAQVTITVDGSNSVTDRAARVNMTLSAPTKVYAQFGPTASYGTRGAAAESPTTSSVLDLSGLSPGITNHYRICQDGFTPPTGCTADQTVATLTAQSVVPIAPTAVDVTYPASFTAPSYTVNATCSNLQSHIDTARARDGNENILITIPAGVYCATGSGFAFAEKTGANPNGTGTIVIQTDGVLPPLGTRLTTAYEANLGIILQNTINGNAETFYPATCNPVEFQYRTDLGAWGICNTTNTWTLVSAEPGYTTGAGDPGATSCDNIAEVGHYYYKIGAATNGLWYCHSSLRWINFFPRGDGGYALVIPDRYAATVTTGYRLVGVKCENMLPSASTSFPCFITQAGANRVIFDRTMCRAPSPGSIGTCYGLNGANVAVVDSYVDEVPKQASNPGVNITSGPGPFRVTNNYISSCFVNVFVTDNDNTVPRSDITIAGNYLTLAPQCNPADALYDGFGDRSTRAFLEFKRGTRVLVSGNKFFNGYASAGITVGTSLIFSPRSSGSSGGDDNAYQISDVDIVNNEFRHVIGGVEVWGQDNQWLANTRLTARFRFSNNLGYDINGKTYSGTQMRGPFMYVQDGITGLTVRNNTWFNSIGTAPATMVFGVPMGAVDLSSNVLWANLSDLLVTEADVFRWSNSFPTLCDDTTTASSATYTTRLNKCAVEGVTPFYTVTNNAIVGGYAGATAEMVTKGIPAGSLLPGDATCATINSCSGTGYTAMKFTDPANYSYRLRYDSTVYGAAGVGVNQDAIRAASGEVYNARVVPSTITSSGATISYTAPSSAACTIRITGIADVVDAGGSRFRNTAVTGLASGTLTAYTIHCAQSVSGTFTTL